MILWRQLYRDNLTGDYQWAYANTAKSLEEQRRQLNETYGKMPNFYKRTGQPRLHWFSVEKHVICTGKPTAAKVIDWLRDFAQPMTIKEV